MVFAGEL